MKKIRKISNPAAPVDPAMLQGSDTTIRRAKLPMIEPAKQRIAPPNTDHLWDHTDWVIDGWKTERPDLNVSPIAIINRLERLTWFLREETAEIYARFGLTGPSFAVIATLRRAGRPYQLSQRALMDALQLTSGTISVRIDRLIKEELVIRLPDPNDQRGVLVGLTEKGVQLFEQAAPVHLSNEERLLSALDPEQREKLASLLRTLLLSFDPIAPEDPQHPARWIGASLAPAHVARRIRRSVGLSDAPGLLVQTVAVPSLASEAGLLEGDLLISSEGTEIRSIDCLHKKLLTSQGRTIALEVLRGTESHTLHLNVEALSKM
ncbi:MAG TPA: MarR family transcriptional regulator [Ktedonobacteraceae bacterium]|nr:MarR family transcriptional regulator [Ktedonobacteraceae bacterium]